MNAERLSSTNLNQSSLFLLFFALLAHLISNSRAPKNTSVSKCSLFKCQWLAFHHQELYLHLLCCSYFFSSASQKPERYWLEAKQAHGQSHPLNPNLSTNGLKAPVFGSATLLVNLHFNSIPSFFNLQFSSGGPSHFLFCFGHC